MPEYVLSPTEDDTELISIVDTEQYNLATTTNVDGSISFDADAAAFTNVPANDWENYLDTLEDNKIYRVEAGSSGDTYIGFISTYDWGEDLGIYMPGYDLYDKDISNTQMLMSNFSTSSISENIVVNSLPIYSYGDCLFSAGSNYYKVINYELTDDDGQLDVFDIWINASMPMYVQMWYKRPSDSTVNRIYADSYSRSGNSHTETVFTFNGEDLMGGDIVYFIIYNPDYTGIEGSICIQNQIFDDVDDEPGSAYEQYINNNSINYATYTPGYNTESIWNQYGITRHMDYYIDIDTFYLNNTSNSNDTFDLSFNNTGYLSDDGEQIGTTLRLTLYYVDFDDDSHFILRKQSSMVLKAVNESWGYTGLATITFVPRNEDTKYFIAAEATSAAEFPDSVYSFYAMLYPNS